jgi:hypothetical protein
MKSQDLDRLNHLQETKNFFFLDFNNKSHDFLS